MRGGGEMKLVYDVKTQFMDNLFKNAATTSNVERARSSLFTARRGVVPVPVMAATH